MDRRRPDVMPAKAGRVRVPKCDRSHLGALPKRDASRLGAPSHTHRVAPRLRGGDNMGGGDHSAGGSHRNGTSSLAFGVINDGSPSSNWMMGGDPSLMTPKAKE